MKKIRDWLDRWAWNHAMHLAYRDESFAILMTNEAPKARLYHAARREQVKQELLAMEVGVTGMYD